MPTKTINNIVVKYSKSDRPDKKWKTTDPDGKVVYFGSAGYEDYTIHKDQIRRDNYRKRHAGIKLKDGTRAIDKIYSPAWLSYHILW